MTLDVYCAIHIYIIVAQFIELRDISTILNNVDPPVTSHYCVNSLAT